MFELRYLMRSIKNFSKSYYIYYNYSFEAHKFSFWKKTTFATSVQQISDLNSLFDKMCIFEVVIEAY